MRRHQRGRKAPDRDRGAVAIIMAVSMTFLAVTAALVLDFGLARFDRTSNKLTADAAVTGGLQSMYSDDERKPWRAVCTALAYLRANGPELTSISGAYTNGAGGAVSGDPCVTTSPLRDVSCQATDLTTWARWDGSVDGGRISVQIRSGYVLPDPAFPDDTILTGDDGEASDAGCGQLAVIVSESRNPGLGSLVTNDEITTQIRSVGRAAAAGSGLVAPALVLLEQNACNALTVGGNPSYIVVKGTGITPGSIHVDSAGNCTSGSVVINGRFSRHIIARAAELAETGSPRLPGLITTVAATGPNAARASDGVPNTCAELPPVAPAVDGVCVPATGRSMVGRRPADVRYLPGVRNAVAAAATLYNHMPTLAAPLPPPGYVLQPGGCDFKTSNGVSNTTTSPVFVDCPGGATFSNAFEFTNAPSVVFNGPVEIKPNGSLSAPNATKFFVKGDTAGLAAAGALNVNNGTAAGSCTLRAAAPAARLVIGGGPFVGSSQSVIRLCNTTVLMADNSGTPTCPFPTVLGSAQVPPNGCKGSMSVGAGGSVEWTAPNLIAERPTAAQTNATLEDLAFWTETATGNTLGGGGTVNVTGVFSAPNASPFTMSGGTSQTSDTNAQFIARSLLMNGSGSLFLRPDPNNSIILPAPANFALVR